jgi:hypothetical protein
VAEHLSSKYEALNSNVIAVKIIIAENIANLGKGSNIHQLDIYIDMCNQFQLKEELSKFHNFIQCIQNLRQS